MERRAFIQTLAFSSGTIFLAPENLFGAKPDTESIKISMIYNNIGSHDNLQKAWGLSMWIETKEESVLFDTGGDPSILYDNLNNMNFDINKLSKIFISHKHWDHINGLELILEKHQKSPDIFIVESDYSSIKSKYPNGNIIKVKDPSQIGSNIWTTGELKGAHGGNEISEQSLILVHGDSLVLLTGCSHSGIVEMVKKTKQLFPEKKIELVAGGFHLGSKSKEEIIRISDNLKELEVQKIAPSHCTGDLAIDTFKANWDNRFINLNIGNELTS